MNCPTHDFAKTLGAFLPLRVGGVCGADGERAGVRCAFPVKATRPCIPIGPTAFIHPSFAKIFVSATNCSKLNFSARSWGEMLSSANAASSFSFGQSCFNSFNIILRR